MKYSKYNLVGIGIGFLSLVAVITRYYVAHPDIDKLIYYSIGCIALMLGFYILDVVQRFQKQFDSLETNLQARFEKK